MWVFFNSGALLDMLPRGHKKKIQYIHTYNTYSPWVNVDFDFYLISIVYS